MAVFVSFEENPRSEKFWDVATPNFGFFHGNPVLFAPSGSLGLAGMLLVSISNSERTEH